ncbi:MAG: hypothetical protein PHW11_09820, partial [Anaerolineaceae bacterium]|nr:hypothetical protein [Anaerolineaceae bacterium]
RAMSGWVHWLLNISNYLLNFLYFFQFLICHPELMLLRIFAPNPQTVRRAGSGWVQVDLFTEF